MKKKTNFPLTKLFYFYFTSLLLSFGGGFTFIELMREKLFKNNLLSEEEFTTFFTWAQILPGPIAFNFSILSSYQLGGFGFALSIFILIISLPIFLSYIFFYYLLPYQQVKVFFEGILLLIPLIILRVIIRQIKNFSSSIQYLIVALSLGIIYFLGGNSIFILIIISLTLAFILPPSTKREIKNKTKAREKQP